MTSTRPSLALSVTFVLTAFAIIVAAAMPIAQVAATIIA